MGYFKALLQVLYGLVRLKINGLLAGKVHGELHYGGVFLVNWELK
jgi:predicted trehalose synthase